MLRLGRPRRRKTLPAVEQRDLESLLGRLGLHEAVLAGQIKCGSCRTTLSIDSLGGVVKSDGGVVLICDKADCAWAFLRTSDEPIGGKGTSAADVKDG